MTQRAQVLHMLRVAPGQKVTGEQLIAAGVWRYTARIEELRKGKHNGLRFDIKKVEDEDSPLACYRLIFDPERDREAERGDTPTSAPTQMAVGTHHPDGGDVASLSPARPLNPYEYDLLDEAA